MIQINQFIASFTESFQGFVHLQPWELTGQLSAILQELVPELNDDYLVTDGIAIHKTATIQAGAIIKSPALIGAGCFVGANACLRNGVYLGGHVTIGTGCEIKSSIVFSNTAIAHFNFIGDSIIGSSVNFEAGSITANHYNERKDKQIAVLYQSRIIHTGATRFGSLVGDNCRIGANAVLSPGTVLQPGSIVKRLELVEQLTIDSSGPNRYNMTSPGYSGTPLTKKLGIKPGFRMRVVNEPAHYFSLLGDLPPGVVVLKRKSTAKNLVHCFCTMAKKLEQDILSLKKEISPDGSLWISWPKRSSGVESDISEDRIREIALKNGLVDVKVCAVDDTWSALKLVVPLKLRPPKTAG
jgi:acetyltransferase-like isoleucine patch superfamily enzyme